MLKEENDLRGLPFVNVAATHPPVQRLLMSDERRHFLAQHTQYHKVILILHDGVFWTRLFPEVSFMQQMQRLVWYIGSRHV